MAGRVSVVKIMTMSWMSVSSPVVMMSWVLSWRTRMQCMAVMQYYILVTIYLAKTLVKMIPDTDIDENKSNDVRCVHIVIHMTFFLYK